MILQGYTNSDWEGRTMDRKITSGCCFTLGSAMVSWCNKKQNSVALSTTKSEYIALSVAVHEAMWLFYFLVHLFGHVLDSTIIHCDK
jgi:hypothetical protein